MASLTKRSISKFFSSASTASSVALWLGALAQIRYSNPLPGEWRCQGPDLARLFNDLGFIHADQWAKYRHIRNRIRSTDGFNGLAGYLP